MTCLSLSLFALAFLYSTVQARPINDTLLDEYDYIIVGGGASGLTVANRLTEDAGVTVLVLEAGPAPQDEEWMMVPVFQGNDPDPPAGALSGHVQYDWNLGTEAQAYLDGNTRHYPLGRGVGGGSLINGLLWNRGNTGDWDDWGTLGNDGWDWKGMLPYFQRSESFSADFSAQNGQDYSITTDESVHGTSGPVNVSFQGYFYTATENFYAGLNEMGVPTDGDPTSGNMAGAAFLPLAIDPNTKSRSHAKRAYYDSVASRDNFYISNGQFVTRLNIEGVFQPEDEPTVNDNAVGQGTTPGLLGSFNIFNLIPSSGSSGILNKRTAESASSKYSKSSSRRQTKRDSNRKRDLPNLRISGVEFATDASAARRNITARRDVILAAGAVHTPTLLQLSGIGNQDFLSSFNISTAIDLPGVGENLQDHFMVSTTYPFNNPSYEAPITYGTNTTYDDANRAEFYSSHTGVWTAGPPDGVAFPSLKSMTSNYSSISSQANGQTSGQYLADGLDSTIIAGYDRQKELLISALNNENRSQFELLNSNNGHITTSVMKPFTRGTIQIRSRNPFDTPIIDPRYGANPIDLQYLMEGLRFNHRLLQTDAMQQLQPSETYPTAAQVNDDTQLMNLIKGGIYTEYHPSGTASMLPLELGGVVDARLKVYGTQNLKIVDSSIFPLIPAAHLQACVYGVAEKAADLIKVDNADDSSSI